MVAGRETYHTPINTWVGVPVTSAQAHVITPVCADISRRAGSW